VTEGPARDKPRRIGDVGVSVRHAPVRKEAVSASNDDLFGAVPSGSPPVGYGQPAPGYGQPGYGQPGYPPAGHATAWAYGPPGYPPVYGRPTNTMAILSLVMAFTFPPAGLILGIIARRQIRQTREDGDGLALAGIIVGGIATALFALMMIFMVVAFSAASSYTY
jgi:hypothetical protein